MLGIDDFGRDGVVQIAVAQVLVERSILRVDVARLNHKLLDDTVEEQTIIAVFLYILQEIVPVQRRIVEKSHSNFPLVRINLHQRLLFFTPKGKSRSRNHHHGKEACN